MERSQNEKRIARSLDKRIDLVGDPVILEKNGKECSYDPKSPAQAPPGVSRQALHGNVGKVCGAVANVGQQRKDGKEQKGVQRKRRAEMGPTRYKPDHNDDGEDKVIDEAAWLPKPDGVSKELTKRARWRFADVLRWSGKRGVHERGLRAPKRGG